MKRVLIVDDEPHSQSSIGEMLKSHRDLVEVGRCGSVRDASLLISATRPDLLLLDVRLPDGKGFDLLGSMEPHPFRVIFITAYNEYAIRAIKYGALDYILKPVKEMEMDNALERARESWMTEKEILASQEVAKAAWLRPDIGGSDQIVLKSQGYLQVVSLKEILYLRSVGNYTHFHLSDKRKIVVSRPLKEFYEELLPHKIFMRTHRSFVVNVSFIDRFLSEGYLTLKSGEEIPVATRSRQSILAFFKPL